jgi:hypothetical protein
LFFHFLEEPRHFLRVILAQVHCEESLIHHEIGLAKAPKVTESPPP